MDNETKPSGDCVILGELNIGNMNLQAEKLLLIEQLARVQDVKVINRIKKILKELNDPIVGFTHDGVPITKHNMVNRITAAENRIASGEFSTQEDVEKEAANW